MSLHSSFNLFFWLTLQELQEEISKKNEVMIGFGQDGNPPQIFQSETRRGPDKEPLEQRSIALGEDWSEDEGQSAPPGSGLQRSEAVPGFLAGPDHLVGPE